MRTLILLIGLCGVVLTLQGQEVTKAKAYELYQGKKFEEAAREFKAYLDANPDETAVMIDYAGLLSELKRHDEALQVLLTVHQKAPQNQTAYFKLGVEYAALKRYADAIKVFSELEKSNNAALAAAATNAAKRAAEDQKREEQLKAEQAVYDLAKQFKYDQVVKAVDEMESKGEPSFAMQMQRLYAWHDLHQYAVGLERANKLAVAHPNEPDLALLRAEFLVQLGRTPEAEVIWREIKRKHPGTPAAAEAERRLAGGTGNPDEDRVYALANERKHREVIAAVDELAQKGPLSLAMQLQRLYAMQALGQSKEALEELNKIAPAYSNSTDVALLRSDLLVAQHRWEEASAILKELKQNRADPKVALEVERRLESIPRVGDLDKDFWGEAYASGDYFGRFGTVVGSGFVRQGMFIPHARWLQPSAEMRFGADTRSGTTAARTIITDNHVGFYGGVRAQLLPTEYLFVYAQGGTDVDLLERRHDGDWSYDYQAGIYGFKSFGPGKVLFRAPSGWKPPPNRPDAFDPNTDWEDKRISDLFFWRGDWFVDSGIDFSYYHRYASWIGYAQAHEGFRLAQFGPNVGFDVYAVENISWDVEGNYFDNLIEIGPGARVLWLPFHGWEVVLRAEYLNGFYFGRGRDAYTPRPESHYDEIRVALSVGVRW